MANTPNILWTLFLKKDNGKAECTISKSLIDCKGGTTIGLLKQVIGLRTIQAYTPLRALNMGLNVFMSVVYDHHQCLNG